MAKITKKQKTDKSEVAATTGFPSYDELKALVPEKEKRSFTESDYAVVATLNPTEVDFVEKTAGLTASQLFCAVTSLGRAGCAAVAKSVEAKIALKSGAAAFKTVVGGKSAYFAGALTYLLLQLRK